MICAEENVQPNMVNLDPPEGFIPDEMHEWTYTNGEWTHTPAEEHERKPTQEERITALENQLAAYEAAYAQGVNEA